jgi:hypothetical protein
MEMPISLSTSVPSPNTEMPVNLKKSVELNPTENIQHKFDKPTGGMI